jgi:hypothetical protein
MGFLEDKARARPLQTSSVANFLESVSLSGPVLFGIKTARKPIQWMTVAVSLPQPVNRI